MGWSTTSPKKSGWYLVTLQDKNVMPAYRQEYPPGNFTWQEIPYSANVIANMRFPKPYNAN